MAPPRPGGAAVPRRGGADTRCCLLQLVQPQSQPARTAERPFWPGTLAFLTAHIAIPICSGPAPWRCRYPLLFTTASTTSVTTCSYRRKALLARNFGFPHCTYSHSDLQRSRAVAVPIPAAVYYS